MSKPKDYHEHIFVVPEPNEFNNYHHVDAYCKICGIKYWDRPPKKPSWLCRLGIHQWQPVGGPCGMGLGWGPGHPLGCARCGKTGYDSDFGIV